MTVTADLGSSSPWNPDMTINNDNSINSTEARDNLEENLNLARISIGEEDKLKEQCICQLREWISQNSDIEFIPTDDIFLLKFLRSTKYSLFLTQQMILKYMNLRRKFSHFVPSMDVLQPEIDELLESGVIFSSPFRDSAGKRVVIYNIGKFDLQKYTNVDFAKIVTITFEALTEDEETQLLGVNHVIELKGVSAAISTLFSITEFGRFITWGQQSYPMGHKQINLLNVPTPVKYIYDFAMSLLSNKLKQRMIIHESKSSLSENVDKNCLPEELGGKMPMSEMIKLWKEELKRKRDRLLSLERINLLSDQGIIRRKNIAEHMRNAEVQGLSGSFRKLEVD